jgi:hypothetical protein
MTLGTIASASVMSDPVNKASGTFDSDGTTGTSNIDASRSMVGRRHRRSRVVSATGVSGVSLRAPIRSSSVT